MYVTISWRCGNSCNSIANRAIATFRSCPSRLFANSVKEDLFRYILECCPAIEFFCLEFSLL